MNTYYSMYGSPVASVAGMRPKPPSGIFESDYSDFDGDEPNGFVLCAPPYTVTRDRALFLTGLREDIISGLRRGNTATITIQDGTMHLSVEKGSSGAAKAARTAIGAVKGSVVTAVTAVLSTPEGIQKSVRNTIFGGPPKPNPLNFISPSSERKKQIERQRANLDLAVVQISSVGSNVHVNAFNASSRPMAGNGVAVSANSIIPLHVLARTLQREYDF
jgi:hypothetical protein